MQILSQTRNPQPFLLRHFQSFPQAGEWATVVPFQVRAPLCCISVLLGRSCSELKELRLVQNWPYVSYPAGNSILSSVRVIAEVVGDHRAGPGGTLTAFTPGLSCLRLISSCPAPCMGICLSSNYTFINGQRNPKLPTPQVSGSLTQGLQESEPIS